MKARSQKYLLILLLSLPLFGAAQIVNVEDKRIDREDTTGWFGYTDLGFNLVNNGNQVISFRGAIRVDYVKERHLFFTLSNYTLLKAAGNDFVNNGFQHFRYNYQINKWLTFEAFAQGQRNEQINLNFRALAGLGPRFNIIKEGKLRANLGLLYMYEYEEELSPKLIFRDHRLSNYLSLNYKPTKQVNLASTTYFQPLITAPEDLRLTSQTSLTIGLTERLRFRTTFSITHDTRVPDGVVNTFSSFTNGVRWEF